MIELLAAPAAIPGNKKSVRPGYPARVFPGGCEEKILTAGQEKNVDFRVTNQPIMATIWKHRVGDVSWLLRRIWGKSLVITLRWSALPMALVAGCALLQPARVSAEWWYHAPKDYEECAALAEKAATKEDKNAALTQCNAKFAGRRKPGGGYTYYDFMQNRSFDIAGPNPTPEEQRYIDQQYTLFLDRQRRDSIVAALAAKQEQEQEREAALKKEAEKIPLPVEAPNKKIMARVRAARAQYCAQHLFSCHWPRLSKSISGLKKILFGSSMSKNKRG